MMTIPTPRPSPERTIRRKVTASGVIWLDGRAYYVSRRLSGRTIPVLIEGGKLVVDAMIPLRKEYNLPRRTADGRPNGWRAPRRVG